MPKITINKDNSWIVRFSNFYQGFAPTAYKNSNCELGNSGQANAMTSVNILDPTYITQGQALTALTNGTQAAAITDLVKFILDKAVTDDVSYALSNTKLHQISATTVLNSGEVFPHTITGATRGESLALCKGYLYYFWQTSCGRYDLSSIFDDDYLSTVPTGFAALQDAPHPSAVKEDIIVFGNGRYLGTFLADDATVAPTKLDFGQNNEVVDVLFHQNKWYIAVNSSNLIGNNRSQSQIFVWDGSAISTLIDDELGVGPTRIGFIQVVNGVIYIAYQDITSAGFKIGYIAGSQIKELGSFTGSLPLFYQKTVYDNVILFLSGSKIMTGGSAAEGLLPFAISQIAATPYTTTIGALAAPFGTPMVASTDSTNFSLAKFSGFTVTANWTSLTHLISQGNTRGVIDKIVVFTKTLAAGASCSLTVKVDQEATSLTARTITTAGKRRHILSGFPTIFDDFKIYLDWSGGSAVNDCAIRSIDVIGHFTESG